MVLITALLLKVRLGSVSAHETESHVRTVEFRIQNVSLKEFNVRLEALLRVTKLIEDK